MGCCNFDGYGVCIVCGPDPCARGGTQLSLRLLVRPSASCRCTCQHPTSRCHLALPGTCPPSQWGQQPLGQLWTPGGRSQRAVRLLRPMLGGGFPGRCSWHCRGWPCTPSRDISRTDHHHRSISPLLCSSQALFLLLVCTSPHQPPADKPLCPAEEVLSCTGWQGGQTESQGQGAPSSWPLRAQVPVRLEGPSHCLLRGGHSVSGWG